MDSAELGRLRWRCRRGAKELDLCLQAWLEHRYAGATPAQQAAFRRLLELPDPDLLLLLLGKRATEDRELAGLLDDIRRNVDA